MSASQNQNSIQCFLLECTARMRRHLRRFVFKRDCPESYGYHNAEVQLDEIDETDAADNASGDSWPHDDPRWPSRCACGYEFNPEDQWQLNLDHLWRRTDSGNLYTLHEAPIGAVWRATWYEAYPQHVGPDGKAYVVKTPGGDWCIDMASTKSNQKWTRTGEAPNFTVNPSILIGWNEQTKSWSYHGWLRNGRLIEA